MPNAKDPAVGRVVRVGVTASASEVTQRAVSRRRRLLGAGLPARQARAIQVLAAAVGAHVVAVVCGLISADYVEAAYFSLILPALSGLGCAAVVSRVGPDLPRQLAIPISGGYAVCSAAFAFLYADTPYGSVGTWLPPLACSVGGALLWPYVDPSPPKHPAAGDRKQAGSEGRPAALRARRR